MAPLDRIEPLRGREARVALRKENPTMRVTMTESRQAAPDGVHVVSLIAGEDYDLPDYLARKYVERGQAVEVEVGKGPAPENKAEAASPENKVTTPRVSRRRSSGKGKGA